MYCIISYENESEEQKIGKLVSFSLTRKFSMPLRARQTASQTDTILTDSCFLSFSWIASMSKTRVLGCHIGFLEA
jgi:hypothetical protein